MSAVFLRPSCVILAGSISQMALVVSRNASRAQRSSRASANVLTHSSFSGDAPRKNQEIKRSKNASFGAVITLRGTDKGRRALEAEEGKLPLEHVGHILPAMVMPDGKATSDALGKGTETMAHSRHGRGPKGRIKCQHGTDRQTGSVSGSSASGMGPDSPMPVYRPQVCG